MSDPKPTDFPSGHRIWFYPQGHNWCEKAPDEHKSGNCYSRCPGKVSGASTLAKNDGSDSFGLTGHYERVACAGVSKLVHGMEDLSWAETGDSVQAALRLNGLTATDDMNRKGDIGTAAHSVLEHLAEHDEVPPFSGGHELAVISWWKATRPEVVYTEQAVFDPERRFAGMFDLQYGDQTSTMLDLKTGGIRRAAVIQLNIYRLGSIACGLRVPDRLAILDTHDDGSWAEIEVPINAGWAQTAIQTAHNGKDIEKSLRAAIKVARTGASEKVAA